MIQNLKARLEKKEEGFTLVELLIVIVILGILAAIVVFAVGGITDKGRDSAKAADQRTLESAEEAFYAKSTANPVVYVGENALVTDGLLRSVASTKDICLSEAVAATATAPAIPAGKKYVVVDAPASGPTVCPGGFSHAA